MFGNIGTYASTWGVVAWMWSGRGLWALTLPQASESQAIELVSGRRKPPVLPGQFRQFTEGPRLDERELLKWLRAYLEEGRWEKPDITLDWTGFPVYHREVLLEVGRIPCGQTGTYGEVAQKTGNPRAARAVGGALRSNPYPLLIPCHRVLAQGGIGGFSGARNDISLKQKLLDWERQRSI